VNLLEKVFELGQFKALPVVMKFDVDNCVKAINDFLVDRQLRQCFPLLLLLVFVYDDRELTC